MKLYNGCTAKSARTAANFCASASQERVVLHVEPHAPSRVAANLMASSSGGEGELGVSPTSELPFDVVDAARRGDVDVVCRWLDGGGSINATTTFIVTREHEGTTLLMFSVRHEKPVRELVRRLALRLHVEPAAATGIG